MNGRIGRGRGVLAIAAVLVGVPALSASASAAGAKEVVYNNIVAPLPGNFASTGFAATQTSEYGGQVELAGAARKHPIVTVAMSAWACQEGIWSSMEDPCKTPKANKKFRWPLTLSVYSVGPEGSVGTKLTSVTHTFAMPYRPSTSAACTEAGDAGAWFDAAAPGTEAVEKCFHGLAFTVAFHVKAKTLPSNVIIGVAYNTTNYGAAPQGIRACDTRDAGCYYDALNVAEIEPAEAGLTVGADPTESQYVSSKDAEMYCGSTESLGTFAETGACFEGLQPAFKVEAG
jgi:hypothetical protein